MLGVSVLIAVQLLFDYTDAVFLDKCRFTDLTHKLDEDFMSIWPGLPKYNFTVLHRGKSEKGGYYYEGNMIEMPEHAGTHVDAPAHFSKGKQRLHEISLTSLIGEACVVDVQTKSEHNADYQVTVEDLKNYEAQYANVQNCIVIIRTGYDNYFSKDSNRYLGTGDLDDPTSLHFPGVSPEAADFLVQRKIKAIGIDTASIDPGASQNFDVHIKMGKANIPILENLANLRELTETGAAIIALPILVGEGSGAPARVISYDIVKQCLPSATGTLKSPELLMLTCMLIAIRATYSK